MLESIINLLTQIMCRISVIIGGSIIYPQLLISPLSKTLLLPTAGNFWLTKTLFTYGSQAQHSRPTTIFLVGGPWLTTRWPSFSTFLLCLMAAWILRALFSAFLQFSLHSDIYHCIRIPVGGLRICFGPISRFVVSLGHQILTWSGIYLNYHPLGCSRSPCLFLTPGCLFPFGLALGSHPVEFGQLVVCFPCCRVFCRVFWVFSHFRSRLKGERFPQFPTSRLLRSRDSRQGALSASAVPIKESGSAVPFISYR